MNGFYFSLFFLIFFLVLSFKPVYADSSYVLPYPSFMPGNSLYKARLLLEYVQEFWYFGNLSQFEYVRKQSDKYLVEAKTLFEYKQYLLGVPALKKSDAYFIQEETHLMEAKKQAKDIKQKELTRKLQAQKHTEVLLSLLPLVPKDFHWNPEKEESTYLALHDEIKEAVKIRKL